MIGVDEFARRGWRFRQNTEPRKGINTLVLGEHTGGNARPADAVEAVTAGYEITFQFAGFAILAVMNTWVGAREVLHANVFNLELDLPTRREPGVIQVFHHLMLRVNRDSFAAGQILEVDAMAPPVEAKFNSMMDKSFAFHPFADSRFGE